MGCVYAVVPCVFSWSSRVGRGRHFTWGSANRPATVCDPVTRRITLMNKPKILNVEGSL